MSDKDIDDTTAPLIEHLAELRTRLVRCVIAFCVAMVAAYTVAGPIFNFLAAPLYELLVEHGQKPELIFTGLQQGFMTQVRISVFGGFVVAFPYIAFQLWRFVAPGLYRQEKRAFLPFLIASPVLFILGGAFAFFVVMPLAYDFFLSFQQFGAGPVAGEQVEIQYLGTINEYLGLTMKFIIAFGLCFQLPVLLTLMGIAGLVSAGQLSGFRRYAVVLLLIVAALATPPDVMSQMTLFLAIYPLYELSIVLVRHFEKKKEAELRAQGLWDEGSEA
ncbi:twin-arginine translocase subunit TatC [Amaricoccus solimangrovi]|uniref:Sec-independent protein translocase protein TatC n=1 Tax=Amaricoccus solimangrovi TaxID=2589815 RepID=A0A501WXB7_9RHOB|nr:twin-arginine translocase subunit TatC [Amaricoccus solimangrovi]TPE53899.1 twin-arginine translocase subunit TatC [Amaricoccus solimangrovi]